MKQVIHVLGVVLFMVALPTFASAQSIHAANSPKADFRLVAPLAVGPATLPAGEYKFQCKTIDGQDFLVVTSDQDGREVARVPCRPEQLQQKTETSDFRSVFGPDGVQILTAVRIKGEMVEHRLVLD
jgi:hypothetical protein